MATKNDDTRTPPESLAASKAATVPVAELVFVKDTKVPGSSDRAGLGKEQLEPIANRPYWTVVYLRADRMFEIVHYPGDRKDPPSSPGYVPLEQVQRWTRG